MHVCAPCARLKTAHKNLGEKLACSRLFWLKIKGNKFNTRATNGTHFGHEKPEIWPNWPLTNQSISIDIGGCVRCVRPPVCSRSRSWPATRTTHGLSMSSSKKSYKRLIICYCITVCNATHVLVLWLPNFGSLTKCQITLRPILETGYNWMKRYPNAAGTIHA